MFLQSCPCRMLDVEEEGDLPPRIAISTALSLQHTSSAHPGAMFGMLPSLARCPGPYTVYFAVMLRMRSAFATRSAASGGRWARGAGGC